MPAYTLDPIAIASRIAAGHTQQQVAEDLNTTQVTISRNIRRRPEVQALIQSMQETIIADGLTQATSNIMSLIQSMPARMTRKTQRYTNQAGNINDVLVDDQDNPVHAEYDKLLFEAGRKATNHLLQSVGILPTPGISVHVAKMINQTQVNLSPAIVQFLSLTLPQSRQTPDLPVIDIQSLLESMPTVE